MKKYILLFVFLIITSCGLGTIDCYEENTRLKDRTLRGVIWQKYDKYRTIGAIVKLDSGEKLLLTAGCCNSLAYDYDKAGKMYDALYRSNNILDSLFKEKGSSIITIKKLDGQLVKFDMDC